MNEAIKKLPKWAQEHIQSLERKLAAVTAEHRYAVDTLAGDGSGVYRACRIGVNDADWRLSRATSVRIDIGDREWFDFRWDEDERHVVVMSGATVKITPLASNAFRLALD